jgi:3-oxoacyl-[acyl-carrier protein] reductase
MDLGLKGKRALVQGASTGLGRAVAEALAAEGAKVAICARDKTRLEAAGRELGAAATIACDLSNPGAGTEAVKQARAKLGGLDILVTNTGGPPKGQFAEITAEQWAAGFQGLWMSAVESIQAALPGMREARWGRILLVTSAAAKEPIAGLTVSNGLRAGLLGLAKSLSQEVAGQGVTVNALLPGYTDTERLKELKVPVDKMTAQIPAGRLGRPEEFGALAAFLASERAAYITGQALAIDGGYLRGI